MRCLKVYIVIQIKVVFIQKDYISLKNSYLIFTPSNY